MVEAVRRAPAEELPRVGHAAHVEHHRVGVDAWEREGKVPKYCSANSRIEYLYFCCFSYRWRSVRSSPATPPAGSRSWGAVAPKKQTVCIKTQVRPKLLSNVVFTCLPSLTVARTCERYFLYYLKMHFLLEFGLYFEPTFSLSNLHFSSSASYS